MSYEKKVTSALLLAVLLFTSSCIVFAQSWPNPGHPASQVGGGTFSGSYGNFSFPSNIFVGIGYATPSFPLTVSSDSGLNLWDARFGNAANTVGVLLGVHSGVAVIGTDGAANLGMMPDGGYLGVGTTGPDALLDVRGGNLRVRSNAGGSHYFQIKSQDAVGTNLSDNWGYVALATADSPGGATVDRLHVSLGGNVGIGTTSPAYKLDVNGGGVRINHSSGGYLDLTYGSAVKGNIVVDSSKFYVNTQATDTIINSNGGNVGIGTTSPNSLLEIKSGFDTEVLRFGYSSGDYHSINTSFNGIIPTSNYLGFNVEYGSNDIRRVMTLRGDGYVGINTTSPSAPLHVKGGTSVPLKVESTGADSYINLITSGGTGEIAAGGAGIIYIGGYAAQPIYLRNNDYTNRMIIDASGNVGIGTTNPGSKLEVVGEVAMPSIKETTTAYNGTDISDTVPRHVFFRIPFGAGTPEYYKIARIKLTSTYAESLLNGWMNANGNAQVGYERTFQFEIKAFTQGDASVSYLSYLKTGQSTDSLVVYKVPNYDGNNHDAYDVYVKTYWYNTALGEMTIVGGEYGTAAVTVWQTGLDNGSSAPTDQLQNASSNYVFDTSGNVGIGSTNPSDKLVVNDSTQFKGITISGNSDPELKITSSSGGYSYGLITRGDDKLGIGKVSDFPGGNPDMVIDTSGNVGIGTINPWAKVTAAREVNDAPSLNAKAASVFSLSVPGGVDLAFGIDSTTPVTWLQGRHNTINGYTYPIALNPLGGNVGIGTTTPGALLDVNGKYKLRGTSGVLSESGVFGSSTNCSYTNGRWLKLGEVNVSGAWGGSAGLDMELYPFTEYLNNRQRISFHVRNYGDSLGSIRLSLSYFSGTSSTSTSMIKDIKAVNISGSGVTNNIVALWVQLGTSPYVCGDTPVVARYYGNWIAGPYLSTQPSSDSITDSGTVTNRNDYDVAGPLYAEGKVGIGTITPDATLDVSGTINATGDICTDLGGGKCLSTSGTGSGSSPWNSSGSYIYLNNTANYVGIGTSSPSTKLQVIGNELYNLISQDDYYDYTELVQSGWGGSHGIIWGAFRNQSNAGDLTGDGAVRYKRDVGSYNYGAGGIVYIANGGQIHFLISPESTGAGNNVSWGTPVMSMLRNGRVGIGTASPEEKLVVAFDHASTPSIKVGAATDAQGYYSFIGNDQAGATTGYIGNAYNNDAAAFQIRMKGTSSAGTKLTVLGSGNVGIGTSTPSNPLTVRSNGGGITLNVTTMSPGSNYMSIDDGSGRVLLGQDSGGVYFSGSSANAGVLGTVIAQPLQFGTSSAIRMTILDGGNVGIGKTDPGFKLDVAGNFRGTSEGMNMFDNTASDGYNGLYFRSFTNSLTEGGFLLKQDDSEQTLGSTSEDVRFTMGVYNDFYGGGAGSHSDELWLQGGGRLVQNVGNWDSEMDSLIGSIVMVKTAGNSYVWRINNVDKMVMDLTGKVGIGTTSPEGKLHVVTDSSDGNVADWSSGQMVVGQTGPKAPALGFSYSTANNSGYISALAPGLAWKSLGFRASDMIFYYNGGTEGIRLTNGGNVGIGATAPTAKLQVTGANANLYIDDAGAGYNYFDASGPQNFRYSGTGESILYIDSANRNVGIGTTSPLAKLHVNGQLLVPLANGSDNGSPGLIAGINDDFSYTDGYGNTAYLNHYGIGWHVYNGSETALAGTNFYVSGYFGINMFTGGENRLRIGNTGNVGIGTTAPASKLHIQDQSGQTTLGASTAFMIGGKGPGSGVGERLEMNFRSWNNAAKPAGTIGLITTAVSSYEKGDLYFAVKASDGDVYPTEAMRIQSGGNVGIGTTSPDWKLDVHGNATIVNDLEIAGGKNLFAGTYNIPLAVGNGTDMLGIYVNSSLFGIFSDVPNGTSDRVGMVGRVMNFTTGTTIIEGQLASYRSGSAELVGVFARNYEYKIANGGGKEVQAYLASKTVAVYGNSDNIPGALAGLFNGNINVTGTVYYGGNLTGYGADFAEMFTSAEPVTKGDVVCLDESMKVVKCKARADPSVMGVISEQPTIMGSAANGDIPVAIVGIVKTNVKGPIARFDPLTTSSKPGYAELATKDDFGSIIGKAMEACDSEDCSIKVLVGLK
jgi:hypothetical protein